MAKKSRISAAAVSTTSLSSNNNRLIEILSTLNDGRLMENLISVNTHFVEESALRWKQIEEFHFQLSLIADDNIDYIHDLQLDAYKLILSSRLSEAAERVTAEMTAVTDWEGDLINKTRLAIDEINTVEMTLLALVKEKDEKEKKLAELKQNLQYMEQTKVPEKRWRKWLYPAAATATCMAATWALYAFCKSSNK